jgi:hypothetical protein
MIPVIFGPTEREAQSAREYLQETKTEWILEYRIAGNES